MIITLPILRIKNLTSYTSSMNLIISGNAFEGNIGVCKSLLVRKTNVNDRISAILLSESNDLEQCIDNQVFIGS